mgnify:CR=1 FL=1
MKKKLLLFFVISISLTLLASCAPKSFVETLEPTWATIEVRDDLSYEEAWNSVVDTLVKKFDMEKLSKEDGYIRTNWRYTWTGDMTENYRVRATVKFSPDHEKVELKSEAEYRGSGGWTRGYDNRLLSTLKSDIMGQVGRTTR